MDTDHGVNSLAIRGGRVIDPASGLDAVADVLVKDGRIAAVAKDAGKGASDAFDATGLIVTPGFVDLHTPPARPRPRVQGDDRDGHAGRRARRLHDRLRMPNTRARHRQPPPPSSTCCGRAAEAGDVRVLPIGAVTKGRAGKLLAELGDLADAGCIAFSDDGSPVGRRPTHAPRARVRRTASTCRSSTTARTSRSAAASCTRAGSRARLGLKGIPAAGRGEHGRARHRAGRSRPAPTCTSRTSAPPVGVELVRRGQGQRPARHGRGHAAPPGAHGRRGHGRCRRRGPPGLRHERQDVPAPARPRRTSPPASRGLADGTIDCDRHRPRAARDRRKLCEFDLAAFGISGLETALASA